MIWSSWGLLWPICCSMVESIFGFCWITNLHLWGNASEEVLYSSVWVVEARPERSLHLAALVAHVLDVLHHPIVVLTYYQPTVTSCGRGWGSRSSLHSFLLRRFCRSRSCSYWCRCCSSWRRGR